MDLGKVSLPSDAYGAISFVNAEGFEVHGIPLHLDRHEVSFELVSTDGVLRTSEVLNDFRVRLGERPAYLGQATVTAVTLAGTRTICAASLNEPWVEEAVLRQDAGNAPAEFDAFLGYWQKNCHVQAGFKVAVADLFTLLSDLEMWLSRVELDFDGDAGRDSALRRREWARKVGERTTSTLNTLFERFEWAASAAGPDWRPAHRAFARRQLHPFLLGAPFLHRTFRKPLGYAGDYEMVNMISRDPLEGSTLFAQLINVWFLAQPPAQAHRNRLQYLEQKIADIAVRAIGDRRTARILSLGCGPAVEVQEFLRQRPYADRVEFTLLDFNQETIERTKTRLTEIKRQCQRHTPIEFVKKSVMAILRESNGSPARSFRDQYDFVYCAGLFDYLTDPVCRRLSTQLHEWVRPGGIYLSTNVHTSNPWPLVMDFLMDWHLIYRTAAQLIATRPEQLAADECVLSSDATGVNIYLEAKKPER
ncbi:MAG TPA: class I SAM-dependent methyltransferase [Verrucomicrobiae bacterium]|nr:class I SAM-dependent methyltransferase [Verrucomicrobiae bacterium]